MSAFDPTATIFPPRAASACASGNLSSTVTMRPLRRTRSAAAGACAAACVARWGLTARTATAPPTKRANEVTTRERDFKDMRKTSGELSTTLLSDQELFTVKNTKGREGRGRR